jgi:hypothetical protein
MTLAGALASAVPGIVAPGEHRLLSDFLPLGAMYVRVTTPFVEVTPEIGEALHQALRQSTQLIRLI